MFRLFYRIQDYFSKYERHMRRVRRFYNNPAKEETWNLDLHVVEFLIPRLELFIEDSSRIVDWDSDDEHRKVKDYIPMIVSDFRFYLDNYDSDDIEVWKKSQEKVKEGFSLLSKIYCMLGW